MNGINKKLKRKLRSIWKPMKMITPQPKTSGTQQGSHKRKVYSNPGLPKEERKDSDTQPNLTPYGAGKKKKKTANKTQKQQKTGNNKD